ncbi:hypothetical protein DPMN_042443 [Dreissena polymorpha]|uniref:Uncharacterized protein n=1 Tax=Dreissena polymorpha TaxID=45954 RepID=A0A9D4CYK8_DREPO|nr:hypothetical protein DPMN_042443 [Dreissena polymorpha]
MGCSCLQTSLRSKEFQDKCLTSSSTHGNLEHLNNMTLQGGSGILCTLSGKEIPLLQLKV